MADRLTETLLDALKKALAAPSEARLFRAGKLTGLFPGRVGIFRRRRFCSPGEAVDYRQIAGHRQPG